MIQTGFESRVKIQQIIDNQIPDFVLSENPKFVDFLKQYYISQEYQGGPVDISDNLDQYLKLDNLIPEVVVGFTTLSAGIGTENTTIDVSSTKGFPKQYGLLKIDDEIITYTGIDSDSNSFTGCIRGFSGITSYRTALQDEELVFSSSEINDHDKDSHIQNLSSLFLQKFYKKQKFTFTPGLEDADFNANLDVGNFIKESRTLYEAKGTDESFRILFNSLYGEEPKVVNLEEYLIKPSSANYVRRQVAIGDVISGDISKLVGQTLYKETDLDTNASISEIEGFSRISAASTETSQYYKISFFVGYDDSTPTIQGNFKITPSSRAINTVGAGSSIITVDSTIGFGNTGTIISGINTNINYTSKSINQFYGCTGIDDQINPTDSVRNDEIYFGYENGDITKKVQVRLNGVLSEFNQISEYIDADGGQIIAVNNVGDLIENPAEDRTDKEIFANSLIYNTSVRYQVNDLDTITGFDPSDLPLYQTIDRSSLKKGDTVDLFNRSSNNVLDTGKVTAPTLDRIFWWKTKTNQATFALPNVTASGQYDIRRKLNTPISIGASLSASHLVSDVQNLYVDDKNEEFYIASNSLPSGAVVGTGISDTFTYPLKVNVLSVINPTLSKVTTTAGIHTYFKYGGLYFNSAVPFINGDEVSYSAANDPYVGLENGGTYFVGIASDSSDKQTIRIYNSRATVNSDNYIKLESVSGTTTETGHTFTLASQKSKLIGPQNVFKKFPFKSNIKVGEQTKTLPGTIGMLINGVEIVNYKSNDKIYYGPLESTEVLNQGDDYDVINLPQLFVNSGAGTTALIQPVISGSIENIIVDPQNFNIQNILSVEATGGNGTAILEPLIVSKSRDVEFNGQLEVAGGGISSTTNTITFLTNHGFTSHQEVIYNSEGKDGLGVGIGTSTLVNNANYFAHIIDNNTIKLFGSVDHSIVGLNTITLNGTNCSGVHKFITLPTERTLSGINIVDGGTFTNRKLKVLPTGISTVYNNITFKNHGFDHGDQIVYTHDDSSGSISGLTTSTGIVTTTNYYSVFKVDNDNFKLADAGIAGTITSNFEKEKLVDISTTGSGYQNFAYPNINVAVKYAPVGLGTTTQIVEQINLTPKVRGSIIDSYLYDAGTGYGSTTLNFHNKPTVTLKTGKHGSLQPIIVNGRISGVNLQYGGQDYYSLPTLNVIDSSGAGTGAELKPIISDQRIVGVTVVKTGIGYSSTDTSIEVITAGKNAFIDCNVRPLTIDISKKYNSHEILLESGNSLSYNVCGYGNTIRNSFGEGVSVASTIASKIIGWAYDGNPIYGPYGYSNPDETVDARCLISGYELDISNVTDRPAGFDDGYFIEDYKFTNKGDLDINNGRFSKTPEFPNGVYAYFAGIGNTTGIPEFPYFIGDSYRSPLVDQNVSQDFDFENSNLVRNTFPYRVAEKYVDNDFIIESNEIDNQKVEVESVTSGSVLKLDIVDSGDNYKINDILRFDDDGTDGSGLNANVSSVKGKDIVNVSTATSTYLNAIFTWNSNGKQKVTILPSHNWNNEDNIVVSGLSTGLSNLIGAYKIGVGSITSSLIQPMLPSSAGGITTEIYVSYIPDSISIGSSINIGSETVQLLDIFEGEQILRIGRSSAGAAHTASTSLKFVPDSFIIDNSILHFDSKLNNKFYFNPTKNVGFGTLSGISSTVTYQFGDRQITNDIPTQAIYAPQHKFIQNEQVTLTNAGTQIAISDTSTSAQYNLPTTLYVSNLSPNTIGIKTGIGTTSADFQNVFFRAGGQDSDLYSLETNYTQETGKVQKLDSTVSVSTYHNLKESDIVTLDIKPNLSVGVGTASSVVVTRNTANGYILTDPFRIAQAGISSTTDTFTITGHKFVTGDKVYYDLAIGSSYPAGLTEGEYFVYVVDDNTINLCETYIDSTSNPPNIVRWTTSPAVTHRLYTINPQITVVKTNSLVFDLTHSSLQDYKFKLYYDKDFKNEFVSTATTTFNVSNEAVVGVATTAKTTISYNSSIPEVLYYTLEKSGFISTSDTSVRNSSEIKFVNSSYNSTYKLTGVGDTTFTLSLKEYPERLSYASTECQSITYNTKSLNTKGGIAGVSVNSGGSGYKKLPTFVGTSSTEGTGGYVTAESTEIGNISKIRVINEGFEYSADNTLRPAAYISPTIVIKDSYTIGIITVTDGGFDYIEPPNVVMINPTTREKIDRGLLEAKLNGTTVGNIEMVSIPSGLPDAPVELFTTNNTNGIGIKTVSSDNSGIFTCWINTPTTWNTIPFAVNDEVYIEGIVGVGTEGSGFNSADNGYRYGRVKEYDTTGLNDRVVIDYTGVTTNTGIAVTDQNSIGVLINKNKYPQFSITQVPDNFIIGEIILRNSTRLDLIITKSDNDFIKILGRDKLSVGDIIIGKESGTIATIASLTDNFGEYGVDFSVRKDIGWSNDIGKLSEDDQVTPDNDYYQNLSYAIKSSKEFQELRSPVSSLLHTSGLKNFADTVLSQNAGVGIGSTDQTTIIQDVINETRVDTVYNYDSAYDLSETGISSKFIRFDSVKLSDYIVAKSNEVLTIDDISNQFSNLDGDPSEFLNIQKLAANVSYQNILYKVSNLTKTDIQLSEVTVLNDGTDSVLLTNKYMPDENSNGIGRFTISSTGGESYLRFTPLPNAYDYDYDLKEIKTTFQNDTAGVGTQSVGFVNLSSYVGIATTAVSGITTTSIISVDKTKFNSFHVKNQVVNLRTNEMNYVELYVNHDGTNSYVSQFYMDTHTDVDTLSGTLMGSFDGSIIGSKFSIDFENDLSDEIRIKSTIVGFGLTSVGIGTYRFSTPTQPDGAERTALYESNYSNDTGASFDVVGLTSTLFDSCKSIVQVSVGSTKALHQVIMSHDTTNVYVQQSPFLSIGSTAVSDDRAGIGTFGGVFDGTEVKLKFYPDSAFTSTDVEVTALNLGIYQAFDVANISQTESLGYGRAKEEIGLYQYNAINGERVDRKNFVLESNNTPIFGKTFDPSDTNSINLVTGKFTIDNHYFRTGEELVYSANSTFIGIGSTPMQYESAAGVHVLPSNVFAIRDDADSFFIATTRALANAGTGVTFVGVGTGNAHKLSMSLSNTKSIISIDNVIQSPLAFSPVNHTLQNNIVSVLGSTGIGTTSTIFSLSGISSLAPNDILRVDNEYMRIQDIGTGDDVFGPITGIGTTSLVEVERGFVGSSATAHTNTTTVRVYKGSYNIIEDQVYFTNAPKGNPQITTTDSNLPFPTSDFGGRVFLRNNYDTNQIYDDISAEFSGIQSSFTLKVGGANTVGLGTTGGNGLLLINSIYQRPTSDNNPTNNFQIIERTSPTGVTSVQFTGIKTTTDGSIVINESDINENQLPRGGVIISLGSTSGLGYAPTVGNNTYVEIGVGGTIKNLVSTASTGSNNAITTASYDNATGLLEITTQNDHNFELGIVDQVKLAGLEFTCAAPHAGVTTTIFPEAAVGLGSTSLDYSILKVTDGDYVHSFISADNNAVNVTSGAQSGNQKTPNGATYTPTTGLLELTFTSAHGMATGDTITLDNYSLTFTCDRDDHATEHEYPRVGDPIAGVTTAVYVTSTTGFNINVGSSPTYRFTTNVGISTIPHTYVGGGNVIPFYGNAFHGSGYTGSSVSIGITDIPFVHKFVRGISTSFYAASFAGAGHTATGALYNPSSGDLILTVPSHGLAVSSNIGFRTDSLIFTCSKDDHKSDHSYPRATDPVAGILTAITSKTADTLTVNVGSSVGSGGAVTATVGAGGTLTVAISNAGTNYANPQLVIPEPSYAGLGITGVSRLDVGSTTDCGVGLLLNVEVGASSTVGVGSTLFGVTKWEIERNGYAFRRGDVFKLVGLATDRNLTNPLNQAEFTVVDTFNDNFSAWQFGEFDYIDDIKNLQNGDRTRFELKYGGELLSFDTVGAGGTSTFNINLSNSLLIIMNGVIQEPGTAYSFEGGSTFVFSEPPKPEDDIAIFFYRGSPELDTELVTTVQPSIEKGDLVQLGGMRNIKNQKDRTVSSLDSSDTIQTNLYVGPGITSEGISRSLSWTKKKHDKIVDGELIYKSRGSLESLIFPTTKIISDFSSTESSQIFVENIDLFDYDAPYTANFDAFIVDNSLTPVAAALTATVSAAGTISGLTIVSGGSGYVGATTSISIAAPPVGVATDGFIKPDGTVGVGSTATATATITNGILTGTPTITMPGLGYTLTSAPQVIAALPVFKTELVENIGVATGFSGIVTGISTAVGIGTSLAIVFHTRGTHTGLSVGSPISINNTIVGTGLSSIYQSGSGIVGIGTTFVDNIYRIAQITTSSNLGIITCNIANDTNVAGLAATGTESSPIGNFSWGKLTGTFSRSNPISIGVSGLTVNSGLTTFPTISRRDEGIRGTGAIIAE